MIRRPAIPLPRSLSLARPKGFTLIEVAVVVVIISMLLSLGLGALNAQLASAAHAETRKRQALINDALIAYLGANKRLPCPDIPNNKNGATDTSQVTGAEDRAGGSTDNVCSGNIGVVPYATLGLSREVALDGWSNFMSYSIPVGSGTCPDTGPNLVIDWSRSKCFGAAKTAPYSLFEGTVAAPTLAASNVLAVVVSHGPNGFAAWGRQGSRNVLPLRCEEAHNAIATVSGCTLTANAFYKGDRTDVDDVVIALTRDEAINTLVKQGTLKSVEGQVIEDLANLRNEMFYGKVRDCWFPLTTEHRDPWGYEYQIPSDSDAICICSTRGTGASLVVNPTCSYVDPTICTKIDTLEVDELRLRRDPGASQCYP